MYTLLFLGDIMLGRMVNETLKYESSDYIWGNTIGRIRSASLRFANLECAITEWGELYPDKTFCFRTDSKNVQSLKHAHIDCVSLANNHALDYGDKGLRETIRILEQNEIKYAGAGMHNKDAMKPAIITTGDRTIEFIAATDNEPEWEAQTQKPGVFYTPIQIDDARFKQLQSQIHQAKQMSRFVIVSLHWGANWGYEPPREHVMAAHRLIDSGADIIYGHSPHVFRGIELYNRKPIFYSCGNFVDDYAVDETEPNNESGIFVVETNLITIQNIMFYPIKIEECQARISHVFKSFEIANKMRKLCDKLGTSSTWDESEKCLQIEM